MQRRGVQERYQGCGERCDASEDYNDFTQLVAGSALSSIVVVHGCQTRPELMSVEKVLTLGEYGNLQAV